MAVALALSLAAAPVVLASDTATRRGGGGGSASVGANHAGSSGGHASSSNGAHPAPGRSGSAAESRHPRAGTGTGYHYGHGHGHGYYPYYPYYRPYYYGYGYPYWGLGFSYGYGYGYAPYYGYGPYADYAYNDAASIRVLVDNRDARVFVDGYYAGVVDDFDGLFQRLHVSPGRHELTVKADGFKTYRAKVYVGPGTTLKLHYDMVQGSGEVFQDLAGDAGRYARRDDPRDDRYAYRNDRDANRDRDMSRDGDMTVDRDRSYAPRDDQDRDPATDVPPPSEGETGTLRLDIRPDDASVYVDGRFQGSARQHDGVELPAGRHHVEVVRPGFRTIERDVEVEPGRTARLSLELERP
jgi:hypothetical protein